MIARRTRWYPPSVKPARGGVYERDIATIGIRWSHWNGRFWGGFAEKHKQAAKNSDFPSGHQQEAWRGLANKPRRRRRNVS